MRKIFAFFVSAFVCVACFSDMAAGFEAKKSSSVKKQEKSNMETITSGSLLPGVIGLVSNVSALTKQQKELAAECVPTATEINWVNNMVKEYAKAGGTSADKMFSSVTSGRACKSGETYASDLKNTATTNSIETCTERFVDTGDSNMIWYNYPKAAYGDYCADGSLTNCAASKKKYMTNMYKIFGAIDFAVTDLSADEATMYAKIMEKSEKCAPENISKRNKEAYSSFLTTTIANTGSSTNTGSIMQAVGGLTSGGGGLSGIGSLAPTVTQFLDK